MKVITLAVAALISPVALATQHTCFSSDVSVKTQKAQIGSLYTVEVDQKEAGTLNTYKSEAFLGTGQDATYSFVRGQGSLIIDAGGNGELTIGAKFYPALKCKKTS